MLDYERLEAGELHLDATEFSLRGLTASAIGMFAAQAKAKQLSLNQDFAEGLSDGWIGDPIRLRQVLCNLLSNAIKFTQQHGRVTLRVTSPATPQGGFIVRFEVSDSGPGISAEAQLRLFRPYGQGDSSIASRFGGTGLGLSICKELLQLMKGSMEVQSQLGAGATFCVAVPLTPADPRGPQLTSTDAIAQLNLPADLKVMLVEDDLVNQMVMEAVLRDLGACLHGEQRRASARPLGADGHRPRTHGLPSAGNGRADNHWALAQRGSAPATPPRARDWAHRRCVRRGARGVPRGGHGRLPDEARLPR